MGRDSGGIPIPRRIEAVTSAVRRGWLMGLALALLTSCANAPTQLYSGERRSPSEVALVASTTRVKILKIDGRSVKGTRFEALPGEHQIDFKVVFFGEEVTDRWKGMRATCTANVRFIAEPGVEYHIRKLSKKGKAFDRQHWTFFRHAFGTMLTNVTDDEDMPDAVSEMRC